MSDRWLTFADRFSCNKRNCIGRNKLCLRLCPGTSLRLRADEVAGARSGMFSRVLWRLSHLTPQRQAFPRITSTPRLQVAPIFLGRCRSTYGAKPPYPRASYHSQSLTRTALFMGPEGPVGVAGMTSAPLARKLSAEESLSGDWKEGTTGLDSFLR